MTLQRVEHEGRNASSPLFAYLRKSDDATVIDMDVNGVVTAVAFRYTSPDARWARVRRCNLAMIDGSITPSKFGGIDLSGGTGATVKLHAKGGGELFDFMEGSTLKDNTDFAHLAGVDAPIIPAAGDDAFSVRWTLNKMGDDIYLEPGDYLEVVIQDDISALTKFRWSVQGRLYDYDPRILE